MKKKMKIDEIKVESFVTNIDSPAGVIGGSYGCAATNRGPCENFTYYGVDGNGCSNNCTEGPNNCGRGDIDIDDLLID